MTTDLVTPRGRRAAKYEAIRQLIPAGIGVVVGIVAFVALLSRTPAAHSLAVILGAWVFAAVNGTRSDPNSTTGRPTVRRIQTTETVFVLLILAAITTTPRAWTTGHALGAAAVGLLTIAAVTHIGHAHWSLRPANTWLGILVNALRQVPSKPRAVATVGLLSAFVYMVVAGPSGAPAFVALLSAGMTRPHWAQARKSGQTIADSSFAVESTIKDCGRPRVLLDAFGNIAEIAVRLPATLQQDAESRTSDNAKAKLARWNHSWETDFDWSGNTLRITPSTLPEMIAYPGSNQPWNRIPIGVLANGEEAVWDVMGIGPMSLVCGPTGSGKSVLQRCIAFHVLQHAVWRMVCIDLKRVEQAWMEAHDQVLQVAKTLEHAVEVLRMLKAEAERRYVEMETNGVTHFLDLNDATMRPIMLMIDEATNLMALEGIKEVDTLHNEAKALVGWLARTSRAAGIYVCVAMQRPDASILTGELKSNLDTRIAAGRMDSTPSQMVLDSTAAESLPKIKGRGIIRVGGELEQYQGYFAKPEWIDNWIAAQAAAAVVEPADVVPVEWVPYDGDEGALVEDVEDAQQESVEAAEAAEAVGRRGLPTVAPLVPEVVAGDGINNDNDHSTDEVASAGMAWLTENTV